jgi:ParB family chromosome partitioning protein
MQLATTQTPFANGVPHLNAIASAIAELTQHATIRTARFCDMVRSKLNVRKKNTDISELKALIAAQGLLQNLVGFMQVIDGRETGVIEIVAGGRRLISLGELIAEGVLPDDYAIPYLLVTEDEAVAISLAENSGREDMHPADVYDAMMELSKRGKSVDDIAFLFRLDALTVKKRLKLANIAPRLLDLYRNEQASYDQMQALAITDDHAAQEQAWDSLPNYSRHSSALRRLLTAQQVNVRSDRLARYVGVEAFEKAGGVVTRDLFSNVNDGYITDVALLEQLALAKLEKQRAKLVKEGFGWVEILPRADHSDLSAFASVRTKRSALTDEQQARVEELDQKIILLDEAIDLLDEDGDEDEFDRLDTERSALNAEQCAINKTCVMIQNADDKALAGAVVTLDDQGNIEVKRDVIRPADKSKMVKLADDAETGAAPRRVKSIHSDRLTHELTSQCTVALQTEMMDQGDIALVYLTYTLMRKVLPVYSDGTLAKISMTKPMLAEVAKKSRAAEVFHARREQLLARLPDDKIGGGWLEWLVSQPSAVVMEMMAFCVASTLDATQQREGSNPQFVTLARALKLDMSTWWKATASDYFSHVSKERMVAVVTDAVSPEAAVPLDKMKKTAAAEAAERIVANVTWLPEAMRTE